ncbi:MAG: methyltransferase domain-containing protein, partial [Candidatus Omnitrophica bacterium]|nr:methyltransferase domain-containing protein [Candidatus Omnitrophota bacterium]
ILWASAPSQHSTWQALIPLFKERKIDPNKIICFHMDEYVGLEKDAPQLFGKVLREKLFSKLGIPEKDIFYFHSQIGYDTAKELREKMLDSNVSKEEISRLREELEKEVNEHISQIDNKFKELGSVFDIVVGGIGVHPHLAFNDWPEAKFDDPRNIKVVTLSETSRIQQVEDREFKNIDDVPTHAITFTLPPILNAEKIHIIVPRLFKAEAVKKTLEEDISERIPASGLRLPHILPKVYFYFDKESSSKSEVAQMVNERMKEIRNELAKFLLTISAIEFIRTKLIGFSIYSQPIWEVWKNIEKRVINFEDLFRILSKLFSISISLSGGKIIEFYLPTFFSKEGIIFWDNNTKELKEKREYLDNLLIALLDLMIEKAKNLEGVEIWRGFIEEARDIKSRLYIPSQDSERLVRNIKEYFFKDKLPDVCDNTLEDTENNKEEFRYTDVDSIVLSWDSSIDLLKMWLENKGEKLDLNGKRILFVGAETEKVPNELKRKYPSSTIIVVNPRKDWLKYHLSKEIIFINDIIQNIPNYKISDIDLIFSSGLFNIEWQKNVVGKGSYKDKLDIMFKAMASVLNDNGIILITTGIDDNPIMEEAAKKNNLKIKMISKKSFIYCIYKERNQNGIDWDEIDELLDQDISHLVSNRQKGDFAPCSTGKISKIFNKINIPDSAKVLDLGSGTAKLCILLSLYNDKFLGKRIEITGIEYYPDIYNIGVIKNNHFTMLGYDLKNIDLIQGDFFEFSWQKYDIIFYAARGSREEEKITQKLIKELKTGGKFVMFSSIGVERCFYNERAFFMPQLFNENIFAIEYFPELGVIIFTKKNNPYHRACGWGVYEFDKLKEKGRLTDSAKAKTINILMKAKNEGRLIKFNELPNLLPYQSIHNLIIKHYKIKEMLSNHSLYLLLPKDEEFLNSFYSSYLWYETPNRFLVATSGNYQEVFDDKRCVHIIPLGLIVLLLSKEHYCPEILIDILNHESKINNFSLAYIKESEDLAKKVFLVSATDNLLDAGINYCITQQAEWLRRDNKDSFEAKLLFKLLSMKIFDSNGEELRRVAKILGILEGKEATPYLSERLKQVTSDEERLALLEGFISTNSDYLFSNYNDILRLTKVDNIFKDRTNTPKMRVKALELLNSLLIYSNQWEGLINLLLKIISDYEEKKEVLERAIRDSRVWLMVDCRREEIINKYKEFKEELGKYEDLKAQGSKKRIQKIINFSISMGELFSKRKHKRITKFYQQLTSKRGNMFISLFPLLLCEGTEFVWLKICMLGLASLFIYFIIRNIYVLNNIDYSLLLSIGHKLKMILFEFHRRKKFIYFLYSINSNNELTKFKSSRKFFGWVRCIFTLIKEFGLKILAFLFMLDTQIILAYIKKYGLIRPDPLTFCNHNNIRFIVICVFIIILSMFLSYYSNIFPILNKILTNFSVSYFTKTPLNLGILFGFLIPLVRKESSQKNIIQIKKEALLNVLRQSRSVRGTERDLSTALTE